MRSYSFDSNGFPLLYLAPQTSTTAPAGIVSGTAVTAVGTVSHPTVTYDSTNPWLAQRRTRYTSDTSSDPAGVRTGGCIWYGAGQKNGFDVMIEFGQPSGLTTLGGSAFVGVCASTSALGGDPVDLVNCVGVGFDSTDALTTQWSLYYNDGASTCTKVAIPEMRRNVYNRGYRLTINAYEAGSIQVMVEDITRGKIVCAETLTSNIPAVNTLLAVKADVYNGAVAEAHIIDTGRIIVNSAG